MESILGIDVSKWQSAIDWKKVKQSGIKFAMIRASYGTSQDSYFLSNAEGAQKVGIETGAYHYCYAKTVYEAIKEAEFFLSVIKGAKVTYPAVLDLEDKSLAGLDSSTLTAIALAFLDTIDSNGYYAMLYINLNWMNTKLNMDKLKKYAVWLADWTKTLGDVKNKIGIWQYTNKGKVDGITGAVDCDESFYDYSSIIQKAGLNHLKKGDFMEEEKEISLQEAIQIVQSKADLEQRTIDFLMDYKFSDVLIKKLAVAMK